MMSKIILFITLLLANFDRIFPSTLEYQKNELLTRLGIEELPTFNANGLLSKLKSFIRMTANNNL